MKKTLFLVLALIPGLATAVICKSVDADGVVSYSDVPAGECVERVKLPEYSRYEPRPIDAAPSKDSNAQGSVIKFQRYRSISITTPPSGGVVRSNQGDVSVVVALDPDLQPGHLLNLTLDGRPVKGSFDGLAIDVTGVDRGTHTLRASIVDASGRVLISSSPVRFTLRKLGLNDSNAASEPPSPPPTPDPGYPSDTDPADYKPPANPGYAPPSNPGYKPPANPGYAPPTNPGYAPKGAFTPNYSR
ncbi:MAG: DUF4124 domain-containing protein [Gammaproteobacteria bacterium]|nr:DUF4124 domain-containing protein [Gammaproteobacteria bacterium]